ncbi:MAG: hypothetical protein AAFR31_12950 [Cyanobacteria bacterium J06627_8]
MNEQILTKVVTVRHVFCAIAILACFGCQQGISSPDPLPSDVSPADSESDVVASNEPSSSTASVIAVEVSGEPNDYSFSVTVESSDLGCNQYADWWEVITDDGALIHRRVLLHSHVEEQPFTRSSSPVNVEPDQLVIVRAHLAPIGYGTQAMAGTVSSGFESIELPATFAEELAEQPPLPQSCAF